MHFDADHMSLQHTFCLLTNTEALLPGICQHDKKAQSVQGFALPYKSSKQATNNE